MKKFNSFFIILLLFVAACEKPPDNVYNHYISQERIIKSFNIGTQQVGDAVISLNGDSATVTVTVKQGTDLSAITPTIIVSPKATVSPASGQTVNFATHDNKYTYVVTSAAGVKMKWTVFIKYDYGLRLIPNTGDWDPNVRVYSDSDYNAFLTCYNGWNGGDGCTSILLPDGDILWTFQDSFIGTIDSNRNRNPAKNTFVRNAAFLQKNKSLQSHVLLNPTGPDGKPATWVTVPGAADGNADLYWEGFSQVVNNKVQMLMGHMHQNDAGNLVHQSTDVAVFSLPDMKLEKIVSSYNNSGTSSDARLYVGDLAFESGFKASDGYTYIYTSDGYGICASHVYVARVANHDLTGQWQYYTKNGWVNTPPTNKDDFADICTANVTQPNVFEDGGKYYMVSQTTCYGLDINIWESSSPTGPFTNQRTLYKIPDRYTQNSTELPHFITYNAFVHHSLSREGELVISYNINPVGFEYNFNGPGTADNYRPHFVRIFNWKN